jgi:2-C-methyl-D-erythritol 4-phosphate cytidylyltransferase
MKKFAVIVAGGSGLRMGAASPKQFLLLKGKPLLRHTIDAFLDAYHDMQVIVVLPEDYLEFGNTMIGEMIDKNRIQITTGGATRFHSVQNGLKLINEPSIIFVHDGVRSLVSKTLIQQCFEQALEKGSAIPAVAATDSIRLVNGEESTVANRNNIRIIQTPQTFKSDILLPAFNQEYDDTFTDEATVVEAFGTKVFLCEGDYNNIKITRPIDLLVAENILNQL